MLLICVPALQILDGDAHALFKAQLGELFLEMLMLFSPFVSFFGQNRHLSPPKPALKWAKQALKRPNRHLKKKNIKKTKTGT